jgi:hypothetical protein
MFSISGSEVDFIGVIPLVYFTGLNSVVFVRIVPYRLKHADPVPGQVFFRPDNPAPGATGLRYIPGCRISPQLCVRLPADFDHVLTAPERRTGQQNQKA